VGVGRTSWFSGRLQRLTMKENSSDQGRSRWSIGSCLLGVHREQEETPCVVDAAALPGKALTLFGLFLNRELLIGEVADLDGKCVPPGLCESAGTLCQARCFC
jgi:hypothetical protein